MLRLKDKSWDHVNSTISYVAIVFSRVMLAQQINAGDTSPYSVNETKELVINQLLKPPVFLLLYT